MTAEQQRHDINDKAWEKIRPHTIGEKGHEEATPGILGNLSTVYSGYCVLEHLGGLARDVWKLEKCTPPVLPVA